jgi:hypothetical protein
MQKVIKIDHSEFLLKFNTSTCEKCHFNNSSCPRNTDGDLLCNGPHTHNAYFVPAPSTPLVEVFKQAAGIITEKTYTKEKIIAAYTDWTGTFNSDAKAFADHLEKFSDPEYKEFLRLKEKFTY